MWFKSSHALFLKAAETDKYLEGRWPYYKVAQQLIPSSCLLLNKMLEIGPRTFPIIQFATYMDNRDWGIPNTILHNANKLPWPFEHDEFGCIIALQVIEHMESPNKFITEALRIAPYLIISFPYMWTAGPMDHRHLSLGTLEKWTDQYITRTVLVDGNRMVVRIERR